MVVEETFPLFLSSLAGRSARRVSFATPSTKEQPRENHQLRSRRRGAAGSEESPPASAKGQAKRNLVAAERLLDLLRRTCPRTGARRFTSTLRFALAVARAHTHKREQRMGKRALYTETKSSHTQVYTFQS